MKYIKLILANFKRKRIRTGLTVASFVVALFLFGLLVAIHGAFYLGIEIAGVDRLVVLNRTGMTQTLPLSYRDKLLQIPGVKHVTFAQWFGGIYQEERNFFPQMAIDSETYGDMFPEAETPKEQIKAFLVDPEGAIVGIRTVKRFGWKLGDRIPLKGTIFPGVWEFNLRGIYTANRPDYDTTNFLFHYKLLDERAPKWFHGHVGMYMVRVADPERTADVIKAIDKRFANSPYETKTDTERAFAASFAKQMGNIEFLILAIGTVVFFTLLLVTGNTIASSVRERTAELAVLKTVGFSDLHVLLLILAESILVAVVGGAVGVSIAKAIAPQLSDALSGMIFYVGVTDLIAGIGLAALIGLTAGAVPAVSAMRLRVVDALRRV
jgi:putative ABC transport system permease protein